MRRKHQHPVQRTRRYLRKVTIRDEEKHCADGAENCKHATGCAYVRRRRVGNEQAAGERRLDRRNVSCPAVEDGAVAADDITGRRGELVGVGKVDVAFTGEALVGVLTYGRECEDESRDDLGLAW